MALAAVSPAPKEPLQLKNGAVVIGGGPAGVAAALALAKLRGWSDVTVVERGPSVVWADTDRSYVFSIDRRGQRGMRMLGLEDDLKEAGLGITDFTLTTVEPSGSAKATPLSMGDPSSVNYWLPRAEFMQVLAEGVEAYNKGASSPERRVRVLTSSKLIRMDRIKGDEGEPDRLAVVISTRSGDKSEDAEQEQVLYPFLVLGCDGINSSVRKSLEAWAEEDLAAASDQGHVTHTFKLRKYPSPATGLRFKVLQLPPNPVTLAGTVLHNPSFGAIVGELGGTSLRIGLLPVKDVTAGRTGNITTKPDHPFWSIPIGDVAAYRAAFREAFPQIDLSALVPDDVMQAYAQSDGGVFPAPQASDGVALVLQGSSRGSAFAQRCGVLLVGDSAHAFPPDLGQGVNSSLADVEALVHHLEEHNDDVAGTAMAYQADRGPEADALARLVQVGFPYQYRQDEWGYRFSLIKFGLRLGLSKLLGEVLVAPPVVFMVLRSELPYTEILRRAEQSTARIKAGLAFGFGFGLAFFYW